MPKPSLWIGNNIYSINISKTDLINQYPDHQVINLVLGLDNVSDILLAIKSPDLFSNSKIFFIKIDHWPDDKTVRDINTASSEHIIVLLLESTRKKEETFKSLGLDIKYFNPLSPREVALWLEKQLSQMPNLDQEAKVFIKQNFSGFSDQQLIFSEIRKISNAKQVDLNLAQKLITPNITNNIFELLDLITSGNKQKAQSLVLKPHFNKEEGAKLQAMLGWQLSTMVELKISQGLSSKELSKIFKISPYVANKLSSKVKSISKSRLIEMAMTYIDITVSARKNNIEDSLVLGLLIENL